MLLGSRLVSPDFDWHKPGRSIFLNANRSVSVMVNEEDHLRIQAVTPGFSLGLAQSFTSKVESSLKGTMHFAQDSRLGYLASSPSNCGEGTRLGVMLQLAGLAHTASIPDLGKDIEIRGLHGETSSGFGALVQVSSISANPMELEAAVKLLIAKERGARRQIEPEELA